VVTNCDHFLIGRGGRRCRHYTVNQDLAVHAVSGKVGAVRFELTGADLVEAVESVFGRNSCIKYASKLYGVCASSYGIYSDFRARS
jgi:hypothetical protein